MSTEEKPSGRKRKADAIAKDEQEIEVDLNAPEPPSKKALRKAKKSKKESTKASVDDSNTQEDSSAVPVADNPDSDAQEPVDESSSTSKARAPKKKKEDADYGIWIGNLAFFTTKDDLMNFFTKPDTGLQQKDITRVHLPQGRPPKHGPKAQNKGFAYIDFSSKESQEKAIALSEKLLGGRRVLIKGSKNFEGRPEKTENTAVSNMPSSRRIFIGNLSFDMTVDDLEHHFSKCGTIENVHMATFQDSGKCKGYAWVTFEELISAERAVRGWVDTPKFTEESAESDSVKNSQGTTRRVQVNKIFGRQLRMEFAEDATTRYKKRFGKGSDSQESRDEADHVLRSDLAANDNANSDEPSESKQNHLERHGLKGKPQGSKRPTRTEYGRYEQATVQKMTGAAVAGEGKKITFD